MRKLAPTISAVIWALWLVYSLALTIAYSSAPPQSLQSIVQTAVAYGAKGAGIALSILLCRRPQWSWALMLAGVCLFVLWKFYVGYIIFRMHPALGGLTFRDSVADWWQNTTSSPLRFIAVPFGAFALLSLVFWPAYGLAFANRSHEKLG